MKEMKFTQACRDFFGFRPGEGLKEFAAELRALTEQDKAEIAAGLEQNGYKIVAA